EARRINNCVGSRERRVTLVIWATIVLARRALSRSFWMTSTGRTLATPVTEKGKLTSTTSPRLTFMAVSAGQDARNRPPKGRSSLPGRSFPSRAGKHRPKKTHPAPGELHPADKLQRARARIRPRFGDL